MSSGSGRHGAPSVETGRVRAVWLARVLHRPGQAVLLLLLATLLVTAAATGPLYERAVEQAAVHTVLDRADPVGRGLEVVVDTASDAQTVGVSGRARELFDPPVVGTDLPAKFASKKYPVLLTRIASRDRECTELVFTAGRCPAAPDEVAASASTAAAVGLRVGSTVTFGIPNLVGVQAIRQQLRIVGLYQPFTSDNNYWFGHPYSTTSGITESEDGLSADAFFGTPDDVENLASKLESTLPGTLPRRTVDLALRANEVNVQDVPVLRSTIDGLSSPDRSPQVSVVTGLGDSLDTIEAQRSDARTIVLVLAVQLAALAAIALGVVVAAAADQRRPELALLRLRGLGRGRAALAFTRELGLLVLVAVVPGAVLAWLLTWAASVAWLRQDAVPEVRWPAVAAAVGAAVVGVAVVLGVAVRTVRAPISALLRQVPATTRRGVGLVEVAVAVVAIAGLVTTFVDGSGNADGSSANGGSPLALLTPTCVAVLLGVIGSRLVEVVARRSGHRQLARGAVARGLALLAIARRSGARLTVVILATATALVVFAGQQNSGATASRAERAAAVTGAPVILQLAASDASTLDNVVRTADPGGRYAMPVIVVNPPGINSEPLVAIDPARFGAIATWGRDALRPSAGTLSALDPPPAAPAVNFTTTALTLDLTAESWQQLSTPDLSLGPTPTPQPSLVAVYQHPDGRIGEAAFGPLPQRAPAGGLRLGTDVICDDGCRLAGLGIDRPILDSEPIRLDLKIASLTEADGTAIPLGRASDWGSSTPAGVVPGTSTPLAMTITDGTTTNGLTLSAVDTGGNAAAQHLDVPIAAPVLAAGAPPTTKDADGAVTGATLTGGTARIAVVGSVSFIPQVGSPALLEDLGLAVRQGSRLDASAQPSVWLAADDPTREAALVKALGAKGMTVIARSTTEDLRTAYARTAPGWSNQLALIVGVLAELLAVLLVVLVVLTGRRGRQRDLAGLRLVGIDRRILQRSSTWELGVLVLVGMVAGVVAGLVGTRFALPSIPVFVTAPPVPIPVVHPLQWWWLVGTIALGVVLLVPTVVTLARRLVAGAVPARVSGDAR